MRPSSIRATLAEGTLSSASASPMPTRFSLPFAPTRMSRSRALGSAADARRIESATDSDANRRKRLSLRLAATSGGLTRLAGERCDLVAHPVVTLVAVVAGMPEEADGEGHFLDR